MDSLFSNVNQSESPIAPLKPIYRPDSTIDLVEGTNNGGIFLFETERHLSHTRTYVGALCSVWFFGCWICTIPSAILTIFVQRSIKTNRITRAKILLNIAFIFSFFGLLLFSVQMCYLIWLLRYGLHRFHLQ